MYYGDELGMEGGADPECRRPMRWDQTEGNALHSHFQTLARLRQDNEALRNGSFRTVTVLPNGLYAYKRATDKQILLCVLNTSLAPAAGRIELPEDMAGLAAVHDLYGDRSIPVNAGGVQLSLRSGEGLILA